MTSIAHRRRAACLSAAAFSALLAAPLAAWSGPFDYRLQVTPEEGPVDPAIDKRYTAPFAACQAHAATTEQNSGCFQAEFLRQDQALDGAWKAALDRLPAAEHAPLLAAQRRWIAGRDPFCMKQSDAFSGGTIAPVAYVSCRVELTIRRTIWLEKLR